MADNSTKKRRGFRLAHLLLFVPYVAILWVPFYDAREPQISGVPFFYWYQLLWIVLGAVLLLPAYLAEMRDGDRR